LDEKILPLELKYKPSLWEQIKNKIYGLTQRFKQRKYLLHNVGKPLGAPTFSFLEGGMVTGEQPHPEYIAAMVRLTGEVITPALEDTPESLASLVSQAACDHEYPRVIVYPISGKTRVEVMDLLQDAARYPTYEYREANIVGNDDLDSQTIIYKHAKKSHVCKPF
jgi:hypothetical protein